MPEEVVQRNIRVICNVREVIPHIRAGVYRVVAGLFNGGLDVCRVVVHLDLHHVAFHLGLGLYLFVVQLIKPRHLHLLHIVAAQWDRVGGGNASGIRGHGVHHTAGIGIDDFKHRALKPTSFWLVRKRVVLCRLLDHLDLSEERSIFHDKLGCLPAPDSQRAHGIVQHIAFRGSDLLHLDLDFALAVCQQVVQFDVAVLIGTVLANQVVVPILDEKAYPIDALACHGVDLFNAHAGELFIFKGDGRQLPGRYNHVLRGRVQPVTLRTG